MQDVARRHGLDGFSMLTIYPKRGTLPGKPPDAFDVSPKHENEQHIAFRGAERF